MRNIEARGMEESLRVKEMTAHQEDFCISLIRTEALKIGEFKMKIHDTYPEAPLSRIYFDLRKLPGDYIAKTQAVDVYEDLIRPIGPELLAGIPTAATPFVSSLADRFRIGMITPRTDIKTHGAGAKIDGLSNLNRDKKAILIDDLITGADSKIEAIDRLAAEGIRVDSVAVLIDREQGGKQELAKRGVKLYSALTMKDILGLYKKTDIIDPTLYNEILANIEEINVFVNKKRGV